MHAKQQLQFILSNLFNINKMKQKQNLPSKRLKGW